MRTPHSAPQQRSWPQRSGAHTATVSAGCSLPPTARMLRNAASRVTSHARGVRGLATAKLPDLPYDFGALQPVVSGEIMQARGRRWRATCAHARPDTPAHLLLPCMRQLHHSKHHNTYVTNYNIALQQYAEAEQKGDIARMIALQPAIKFNGGGAPLRVVLSQCWCAPLTRLPSRVHRRAREPQPVLEEPVPAQGESHTLWLQLRPARLWLTRLVAFFCHQDFAPPSGEVLQYITRDFGSLDALVKKFSATAVGVQGSGWGVRSPLGGVAQRHLLTYA
jgi:superoxide dismutase